MRQARVSVVPDTEITMSLKCEKSRKSGLSADERQYIGSLAEIGDAILTIFALTPAFDAEGRYTAEEQHERAFALRLLIEASNKLQNRPNALRLLLDETRHLQNSDASASL